jgi:exonuclease III
MILTVLFYALCIIISIRFLSLVIFGLKKLFFSHTPIPITTNNDTTSNQFGYHSNNLTDYCGNFTEEFSISFINSQTLSKSFKIMTWNIWGMNKRCERGEKYLFLSELMMLRMEEVVKCFEKEDPDVIILQEMTHESISMIRGFMTKYNILRKYKGYGHHFTSHTPDKMENIINRGLDNYVFSKYTPEKISQYCLKGNLGYTTGVTCVFFSDICIVGCYLQAGSKHSPGQQSVWHHYSRCRSEQIDAIGKIIDTKCSDKTIILCGDFNMDLDGDVNDWPEVKNIGDLQMIDTWRKIYPDKKKFPGFTEDTNINHMRWNMKFMEKMYRYDGIFLKTHTSNKLITVTNSALIGRLDNLEKETICGIHMDDEMFDDFTRLLSNRDIKSKPRTHTYHPSDHFGVISTFEKI